MGCVFHKVFSRLIGHPQARLQQKKCAWRVDGITSITIIEAS